METEVPRLLSYTSGQRPTLLLAKGTAAQDRGGGRRDGVYTQHDYGGWGYDHRTGGTRRGGAPERSELSHPLNGFQCTGQ